MVTLGLFAAQWHVASRFDLTQISAWFRKANSIVSGRQSQACTGFLVREAREPKKKKAWPNVVIVRKEGRGSLLLVECV